MAVPLGVDAFLIFGVLLTFFCYLYQKWKLESRLPPVPRGGLWLWGNVKQFHVDSALEQFLKWQSELGDIYRLNLGGLKAVVLSGEEYIYEALVKKADSFSGRPDSFRLGGFKSFKDTVSFANDTPHWRNMKKALMTYLKMYGETLLHLESIALESIQDFIETIQHYNGQAFDPEKQIHFLTTEIMSELVCSERIPVKIADKIRECDDESDLIFAPFGEGKGLDVFPFLRHFGNSTWKTIQKWSTWQWDTFEDIIKGRKEVFDVRNPTCLIDALYRHQTREKQPNGRPKIDDTDIHMITREAIGAGVLTTFRATYSFIAIMTGHPEVQKRLQQEVDEVVGNRQPRLTDRPYMHYTEAAILELLRYISHVPLLLPHMTTKTATINAYLIPKGTQVWINVYSLHHDERYWDKPWNFIPERFLDKEGCLVTADHPNRRRLLPFGAGRRVCPGEVLARNRLFLFVSSFMQKFNFVAVEGEAPPMYDPRDRLPGLVTKTPNFKVRAQPRYAK